MSESKFDVIVVGGGHAGCEAAAAAARMGARTALVTHTFATVGEMSCNPAIGGLGKGHLVREVDALDGLMGRVADAAGIQFRLLNRSKGPAVQGPRAQADRKLYRQAMQAAIRATANLEVIEGGVEDLIVENGRVCGRGDRRTAAASAAGAVVLTTGTFLNGLIHLGEQQIPAGRSGEAPGLKLSERLYGLGLQLGRLKTGTPARLSRAIDRLGRPGAAAGRRSAGAVLLPDRQDHDAPGHLRRHPHDRGDPRHHPRQPHPLGHVFRADRQRPARATARPSRTRSCALPTATTHQVFLEPEGLDDDTVYPNGISTSLPAEVQEAFIRTMPGLENGADQAARLRHRIRLCRPARAQPGA